MVVHITNFLFDQNEDPESGELPYVEVNLEAKYDPPVNGLLEDITITPEPHPEEPIHPEPRSKLKPKKRKKKHMEPIYQNVKSDIKKVDRSKSLALRDKPKLSLPPVDADDNEQDDTYYENTVFAQSMPNINTCSSQNDEIYVNCEEEEHTRNEQYKNQNVINQDRPNGYGYLALEEGEENQAQCEDSYVYVPEKEFLWQSQKEGEQYPDRERYKNHNIIDEGTPGDYGYEDMQEEEGNQAQNEESYDYVGEKEFTVQNHKEGKQCPKRDGYGYLDLKGEINSSYEGNPDSYVYVAEDEFPGQSHNTEKTLGYSYTMGQTSEDTRQRPNNISTLYTDDDISQSNYLEMQTSDEPYYKNVDKENVGYYNGDQMSQTDDMEVTDNETDDYYGNVKFTSEKGWEQKSM